MILGVEYWKWLELFLLPRWSWFWLCLVKMIQSISRDRLPSLIVQNYKMDQTWADWDTLVAASDTNLDASHAGTDWLSGAVGEDNVNIMQVVSRVWHKITRVNWFNEVAAARGRKFKARFAIVWRQIPNYIWSLGQQSLKVISRFQLLILQF